MRYWLAVLSILGFLFFSVKKIGKLTQINISEDFFLSEQNVKQIKIFGESDEIILEKEKSWILVAPFHWPVNPFAVRTFFQDLKVRPLGLPANMKIQLVTANGKISFLSDENRLLNTDWEKYINPHFWLKGLACPFSAERIQQVVFNGKEQLVFEKEKDCWKIKEPIIIPVDSQRFESFLKMLIAKEWLPGTQDKVPKALKSELEIILYNELGNAFTIHFSPVLQDEIRQAWLATPTITCHYQDDEMFQSPLQTLVSLKEIIPDISSIFIEWREKFLSMVCDEDAQWNVLQCLPYLKRLAYFDMQKLLIYLNMIRPKHFVPFKKESYDDEIKFTINETIHLVLLQKNENTYLCLKDQGIMFEVDSEIFSKIKTIL